MKVKKCDKCGAYYITSLCPFCKESKSLSEVNPEERLRTPSDLDIPVFVMCPPIFQKIYIENNVYMEELPKNLWKKFNIDELMREWWEIYRTLSMECLILTLPPNPLLQDLCWVNQAVYLPHIETPTCVISNFKAEGRQPEADLMEWYLQEMGYETYRIPDPEWYFEGEPDLKYLYDNIYIGCYGERTTEEALDWISEKFDANIIKLGRSDDYNYHGDVIFCPISPTKVMCVIPACRKEGLKELEKYAEIIPIEDKKIGEYCITNNVVVGFTIYAGTYIELFEEGTEDYEIEKKKLDLLEKIAAENGYDLVLFDTSQFLFAGAALSCCFMRLNYSDRKYLGEWEEYGK